jgi:hypothetical protein
MSCLKPPFILEWVMMRVVVTVGNLDGEKSGSIRENKYKKKEGPERNIHVHQKILSSVFLTL